MYPQDGFCRLTIPLPEMPDLLRRLEVRELLCAVPGVGKAEFSVQFGKPVLHIYYDVRNNSEDFVLAMHQRVMTALKTSVPWTLERQPAPTPLTS